MGDLFFGLLIDSARCLERRGYYRRVIDFAAERGVTKLLWHFTDDQGCSMHFDSVPGIGSPNAYTPQQIRSLVAYARKRNVELIPELASLGHTVYLTRHAQYRHLAESDQMFSSLCPVAPETRPLIADLLNETCDVFDTSIVHAGLDETNFGHHPLSAKALLTRSRTEIIADHVEFVHGLLKRRGRTMWMWADGLLHDPLLADRLPRDIVQCNWRYRPEEPLDTTQSLLNLGYDVVLCSASISSQQTLFPGEQFALPNIRSVHRHSSLKPISAPGQLRSGRVLGSINTIWTPVRYIANALWLGIDLSIALMKDGDNTDLGARIEAFGAAFYGLSDLSDWRAACERVLRCAPVREEWLAAITMSPADAAMADRIRSSQPGWAEARQRLEKIRPAVRSHASEFDAFLLMVRLADLACTLSPGVSQMSPDEALIAEENWRAMIDEVDAQWNVERFADDPRKYEAPIHHYAGDHLIPLMRSGLERLGRSARSPLNMQACETSTTNRHELARMGRK